MSHSQKACEKVKNDLHASAFKDIDGYYLDPNSAVYKQVFKDWPSEMSQMENWQRTGAYMNQYDKALRKVTLEAKNTKYRNLKK